MREERSSGLCPDCAAALDSHQRYCVACGERVGPRSPQLLALLRRMGERPRAPRRPSASTTDTTFKAAAAAPPRAPLALPAGRVCALLVLVFLGFGVLLGKVAARNVNDTLAASREPMRIVLPSQGNTTAATLTTPASSSPASSSPASSSPASAVSEPPQAQAAPTPEPATTPAAAPTHATAPADHGPGHGSAGGRGGSGSEGGSPGKTSPGGSGNKLPPVKHVFVIMLSDQPYAAVFGPSSAAPYVAQTLERQGELLVHYDAVAHQELADELALLSGQGPTAQTAENCPDYAAIVPTGVGPDEQVLGSGCVYPPSTHTLAGQLTAKHLTWRAYVQGTDEPGIPGACAHPALGQVDPTSGLAPTSSGPYATFVDPFVYFQSVTNSSSCAGDVVGLSSLQADLADPARTPNFSYIAPDRCQDGNPTPCMSGAPAGLAPTSNFLQKVVPEITASPAYKEGGLLVITVDEAPSSGEFADSSSCCGQPSFPNLAATAAGGLSGHGGGAVGALLLSPFVKGATTSQEPFNHFSLLRTIEDLFGLKHLGYAALPTVKSFGASMFSGH